MKQRLTCIFASNNSCLFNFFILLTIVNFSKQTRAANCLDDLSPQVNVCTAGDVKIAKFNVILGPTTCVLNSTIIVQLQAETVSTSQNRFDVGYWIALDGGNARTGLCFDDYLPPPLDNAPTVGLTRISPFINTNNNACGDIEQTPIMTLRNIGGTTTNGIVPPPGPPLSISIPCIDKNGDGKADISACTSWSNNQNHPCLSQIDTVPDQPSKCDCGIHNVGDILIVGCTTDAECDTGDLCNPGQCDLNTGECVTTPVICDTPGPCQELPGSCVPATGTCFYPPVLCDSPPECHTSVGATCSIITSMCNYPIIPNAPPTTCGDNQVCRDGFCVSTSGCIPNDPAFPCAPVQCLDAECNADGTCTYTATPGNPPCGADDICSNGICVECISADNCPGQNFCNMATCNASNECQYSPRDCTSGGTACTINYCDPVIDQCVHTPSDNACLLPDDECNLGFCGPNGCDSEPLTGGACGDPSSCSYGVCGVVGGDTRATCQINYSCAAPDTCSVASCDSATGQCTIVSNCLPPEFCNNASPTGTCLQCDLIHPCPNGLVCNAGSCIGCQSAADCGGGDQCTIASCINQQCYFRLNPVCIPEPCPQCGPTQPCPNGLVCDEGVCVGCENAADCAGGDDCLIASCIDKECHYRIKEKCLSENKCDGGGSSGGSYSGGFRGSLIVPVPLPVSPVSEVPASAFIPTPVVPSAAEALTPAAVPAVSKDPNCNPPNIPTGADNRAAQVKNGTPSLNDSEPVEQKKKGWSCSTFGTDIEDSWILVMILAMLYVASRARSSKGASCVSSKTLD